MSTPKVQSASLIDTVTFPKLLSFFQPLLQITISLWCVYLVIRLMPFWGLLIRWPLESMLNVLHRLARLHLLLQLAPSIIGEVGCIWFSSLFPHQVCLKTNLAPQQTVQVTIKQAAAA